MIYLELTWPDNLLNTSQSGVRYEELGIQIVTTEDEDIEGAAVTFDVLDPDGNNVYSFSETNVFNTTFAPTSIGTYTVQFTINSISYPDTNFDVIDFLKIEEKGCNVFTISNLSTTLTVSESYEAVSGGISPDTVHPIQPQTIVAISLPTADLDGNAFVGLFKIITTYTFNTAIISETRFVNTFCIIEDCIAAYILDILCKDVDRCNPCPDSLELNSMLLLSYTYFMGMNNLISHNNFYNGLSQTQLNNSLNLDGVLKKLLLYCNRKTCIQNQYLTHAKWNIVDSDYICPDCYKTSNCSSCN